MRCALPLAVSAAQAGAGALSPGPLAPDAGGPPAARWKRAELVRPRLEALLAGTDAAARVRGDPVELPHRYRDPLDIEVAALLSAALAYGRVDLFKPRLTALLDRLGEHPGRAARDLGPREILEQTRDFAYRMTGGRDVACLLYGAGKIARAHGTLGAGFAAHHRRLGGATVREALGAFVDELLSPDFRPLTGEQTPTRRLKHLLPHPRRGSACKRLNLFLRWMIRPDDGVDFGLWDVPAAALVIPLDTHVHRIGRFIGLTRRNDLSWRTAEEITSRLRALDARDPVRFDFALSHLGISGSCPSRRDARKCAGCPLQPICRHWS
ncbi:MAG TPA: TIGR02757 family protein [Myxococcales bacterium]|nr:TIGR02757 family protein [Myxococcales bacterium]